MTVPTRVVNFDITQFTGLEYATGDAVLVLRPIAPSVVGTDVVPASPVSIIPNAAGEGTVNLVPGVLGTPPIDYNCTVLVYRTQFGNRTFAEHDFGTFRVPETSGPFNLAELIGASIPPQAETFWSAITEVEYNAAIAAADTAVAAAGIAAGFATRVAFVSANNTNPGLGLSNGQVVEAAGYRYLRQTGATAIADLAGFVAVRPAKPEHAGAVADGTNQRAAFAMWASWGGELEVPAVAGHYLIDLAGGSIAIPSGSTIRGAGDRSKIIIDSTSLVPLFDIGTSDDVEISSIHMVGNLATQKSNSSASCAIHASPGASRVTVHSCIATDWTRHGFDLDGVADLSVSHNRVERTWRGTGILVGNSTPCSDVIIVHNTVRDTQQGNIQAYVGAGRMIIGGNICDGTDAGVTVAGGGAVADNITAYSETATAASEAVVVGNVCRGSGNHGMHIGGDHISVTGNIVFGPQNAGIFIAKGDNVTPDPMTGLAVSGNVINLTGGTGGTRRGIIVRNLTAGAVTGNTVIGADDAIEINGVDIAGVGCSAVSVANNTLVGYTRFGVWLRNKVQGCQVRDNILVASGGVAQDIRHDLVGAVETDNFVFGNMSAGAANTFAQVQRAEGSRVLEFGNANGVHLRVGSTTANVQNFLTAAGNAGTAPPILSAQGPGADIDLQLAPKGNGRLRSGIGTPAASAGAFAATHYRTEKLADGTVIYTPYATTAW